MVSLLVVQIIKYRLGVPVVAMESRIRVQSRNPVKYVIGERAFIENFLTTHNDWPYTCATPEPYGLIPPRSSAPRIPSRPENSQTLMGHNPYNFQEKRDFRL